MHITREQNLSLSNAEKMLSYVILNNHLLN